MTESMRVGEDIGAVVIELGTWYFRIGFAGDDSPKLFVRNLYGVSTSRRELSLSNESLKEKNKAYPTVSTQELNSKSSTHMEVTHDFNDVEDKLETLESKDKSCFTPSESNPYLFLCEQHPFRVDLYEEDWTFSELLREDGLVNDWKALCCLLKEAFAFLHVKPEENACMFVEGERGLQRETYLQLSNIVFQELSMRAVFILNYATAATFASARTTSLVVCVGHKGTSVIPVVEGFTLSRSSIRNCIGGEFLTRILWKYFDEHADVADQEKIEYHKTMDWKGLKMQHLIEDIKHSVCGLWNENEDVVDSHGVPVEVFMYELRKGQFFRISREVSWKIPFVLFQPSSLKQPPLDGLSFDFLNCNEAVENLDETNGICDMVVNAVSKCDPDIRRDLLGNILLIGCSTQFPGFIKCFEDTLMERISPMYRIKTVSVMLPEERIYASWIGGSIVACLVTFQQFWFSREEFRKNGAEFILEKLI